MLFHKLIAFTLLVITPAIANAAVKTGDAAPTFSGTTAKGETFTLADQKGKIVVLEWTNKDCPFVKKHYKTGNMQKLQKAAAENGVVWVSVLSSAEGKQGHLTADEALANVAMKEAAPAHLVLDPSGEIGTLYAAKTTPHMFVIDAEGNLAYHGAIDDVSSADPADVEKANNYVTAAIDALKAGKAVETASTSPYGCSVKYDKY